MHSELIRIPISWHGIPIFGIGVALLVWLAVGAWTITVMAKQVGLSEALKAHLPTLAIVGLVIAIGVPRMMPEGVPGSSYGVLMLAGIIAGISLSMVRAVQAGLDAETVLGLALWVIPGGAIGGRLFYVLQYWSTRIRQPDLLGTIKNVLAFTEGGLVVYGAFIGAMAGFAIYMLRRKLPALAMADIVAPGMMVGLSLGRLGCLMNGCCYGGESHLPWAITFPRENHAHSLSPPYAEQASYGRFYGFRIGTAADSSRAVVIEQVDAGSPAASAELKSGQVIESINGGEIHSEDDAHRAIVTAFETAAPLKIVTPKSTATIPAIAAPPRSLPVHPAQVYSSIDAALLAWVLWSFYPYRRHDGEVMALMLMLHPISRFLLETIRVDEAPVWGTGLSISQNLSVGLFLVGLGLWVAVGRKPRGNLAFPLAKPPAA